MNKDYLRYIDYYRKYRKANKERHKVYSLKHKNIVRFGGLHLSVLERDGYKCVKCGMTNEEHKQRWNKRITIDHIDRFGSTSKIKHNSMENLQTLCLICHGKKDNITTAEKRNEETKCAY